jgi:4'-phosphopantetheinyl transferase
MISQIHLWCAFCNSITDPGLLEQYRKLLDDEERARQARFRFAADRHRYLITRALARTALSRHADVKPELWRFTTNPFGRPVICNDNALARGISFNLSHTAELIVLGVAHERALGVDAENARSAGLEIADRYFAPEEVMDLRDLPEARQPERFVQLWTLKESYIKARGMGLSIPLNQFAFRFPRPGRLTLAMQPALGDAPANWHFWQLRARLHTLAVCARRLSGEPPQLVLKEVVPLVSERDLPATLLASSATG